MTSPKVLLTGPEWFGDLLAFCERGLREAGVDLRVLVTNRAPWLDRAEQLRRRLGRIPMVGHLLDWNLQKINRRKLSNDVLCRLARLTEDWRPALILSILCWSDPTTDDVLRSLASAPKVGWLMDDPFLHNASLLELAGRCDRLYLVDRSWIEPIRLILDCPTAVLPCGADLETHHPVPAGELPPTCRSRIVFVGSSYYGHAPGLMRRILLEKIADLDLHIHGDTGWLRHANGHNPLAKCYRGGELSSREANLVYNGAQIILNIHHPQFRFGTSLRTFGLAATGAFQLVDWRPGLDQYFIPDEEIAVYHSADELREKALYFLDDESARIRVARAGFERVCREHTYTHRVRRILHDTGLISQAQWAHDAGVAPARS